MEDINSPETHVWNAPLPLEGVSLPPWPKDVFPEPFGVFAAELSRSTETPPELAALLTLAAVATAAQKNYQVQVKEDYREPVNLWVLPVLPPASRKSRVYNEISAPLREWEKEKKILFEPVIENATSQRKTLEARLKELRNRAARADGDLYDQLQKEIEICEQQLPNIPVYPQLWTGDVTPEQLGSIMASNDEAMAVLSDEGGVFDILSGLYSDGRANIDLFLQAHSGSPVRVDRKSSPPIFMERALLTMGLTIQPEVIRNICKNKTFRGRGLLGRFLYAIPNSNIGSRSLVEPSMNPSYAARYREAIRAILEPSADDQPSDKQYVLCLERDAYMRWLEYAKGVEKLMGDEIGHLSHITDWAGKLPGAIARIAALLHIMRYALHKPSEHLISSKDMVAAIKIGHVLTNHALVVFDLLQEAGSKQEARAIYNWIKEEKLQFVSRRACMRKFRRLKKDDLSPIFDILKEHEIFREVEVKVGRGGRPSEIFEVNPLIFC